MHQFQSFVHPPSSFEFSLCLSRACLGKMIVFAYKLLKNVCPSVAWLGKISSRYSRRWKMLQCFSVVAPQRPRHSPRSLASAAATGPPLQQRRCSSTRPHAVSPRRRGKQAAATATACCPKTTARHLQCSARARAHTHTLLSERTITT